MVTSSKPTVFHITHWKAGSQWVREILTHCAPGRIVSPEIYLDQFYKKPIIPGGIYPATYVPRERFSQVITPFENISLKTMWDLIRSNQRVLRNFKNFQQENNPLIFFLVLRDLRDTLVSLYFSFKFSHPVIHGEIQKHKDILNTTDKDFGFRYLMDEYLELIAEIQISWIDSAELVIRYEDLLEDQYGLFEKIVAYCKIDVGAERLKHIVRDNSFEKVTGRKRGEEDLSSHLRKGIPGDWKNHFSPEIKEEFKARFGHVLIATGYQENDRW